MLHTLFWVLSPAFHGLDGIICDSRDHFFIHASHSLFTSTSLGSFIRSIHRSKSPPNACSLPSSCSPLSHTPSIGPLHPQQRILNWRYCSIYVSGSFPECRSLTSSVGSIHLPTSTGNYFLFLSSSSSLNSSAQCLCRS